MWHARIKLYARVCRPFCACAGGDFVARRTTHSSERGKNIVNTKQSHSSDTLTVHTKARRELMRDRKGWAAAEISSENSVSWLTNWCGEVCDGPYLFRICVNPVGRQDEATELHCRYCEDEFIGVKCDAACSAPKKNGVDGVKVRQVFLVVQQHIVHDLHTIRDAL